MQGGRNFLKRSLNREIGFISKGKDLQTLWHTITRSRKRHETATDPPPSLGGLKRLKMNEYKPRYRRLNSRHLSDLTSIILRSSSLKRTILHKGSRLSSLVGSAANHNIYWIASMSRLVDDPGLTALGCSSGRWRLN